MAASERDEEARPAWRKEVAARDPEQFVFVDESGAHTSLTGAGLLVTGNLRWSSVLQGCADGASNLAGGLLNERLPGCFAAGVSWWITSEKYRPAKP
jgi:hypothetical protein